MGALRSRFQQRARALHGLLERQRARADREHAGEGGEIAIAHVVCDAAAERDDVLRWNRGDLAPEAAHVLLAVEAPGTAQEALGVGQAALDLGLAYALDRKQFGRPIFEFPRVANKLAMMAAELMGARQLTYFAARSKDEGKRCDLEAGMAKLIGARVAWAAADNALQIHGGNGFATEYQASRLLADARILNIFEGAGVIQAQVIARRLLDGGN